MSIGIGAFSEICLEDNETVIYRYGSYNLNDEHYRNEERVKDGIITVYRKGLVEPKVNEKSKRFSSGRKNHGNCL